MKKYLLRTAVLAMLLLPLICSAQIDMASIDTPGTTFKEIAERIEADTTIMNDTSEGGLRARAGQFCSPVVRDVPQGISNC